MLTALNQRSSLNFTLGLPSTPTAASGTTGWKASATDPRIVPKRGSGWLRQLRTQPLHAHSTAPSELLASVALASVMIVLASVASVLRVLG